ncbi:hypothetical protein [Dasania marina]|uniref:hypothetical protein n=1 Tax=Dasania marina TaxID=471499 RepID=UPI00036B698A|nr:hypothetical protein [Dasania marina]
MDVLSKEFLEILSRERLLAAGITACFAFVGVLIGLLGNRLLEVRREKLSKKVFSASLAVEISVAIDIIGSKGNLRSSLVESKDRIWALLKKETELDSQYISHFPKIFDSKVTVNELNNNWFPVFRDSSFNVGILGHNNAQDIVRFHLLMNSVFTDFIQYSNSDFWGHDHTAVSKYRIITKHLSMLDEAIEIGNKVSEALKV